jgi:cytochrome c oxidase cbb3-type subunit 3
MSPNPNVATADDIQLDEPVEEGRLMTHAYDGIREYDNPLPAWWRMIFVGTIVFGGFYGLYFMALGWGHTPDQAYQAQLADYHDKRGVRERAEAAFIDEGTLARNAQDSKLVAHGAAVFAAKCVSCHTDNGRGLIGPNLTDVFQLHGSKRMDIYRTVHDGVAGTAMLAWGEQLPPTDVIDVATFATTLRGKNIAGKEPQGDAVEPFSP